MLGDTHLRRRANRTSVVLASSGFAACVLLAALFAKQVIAALRELLAALASTLVAAEIADWKRRLDAIVAKLQTNDDASALAKDVDTVTALGRKAFYLSV